MCIDSPEGKRIQRARVLAAKIKDTIRRKHDRSFGKCKVLSKGFEGCDCALCLIDKLADMVKE